MSFSLIRLTKSFFFELFIGKGQQLGNFYPIKTFSQAVSVVKACKLKVTPYIYSTDLVYDLFFE